MNTSERLAGAAWLAASLIGTPAHAGPAHAGAAQSGVPFYQFMVIGHTLRQGGDESLLNAAIAESNDSKPAFVVATGIKAASEACSDRIYQQRRALFDQASSPLVLNLAATDWSDCRNSAGRSAAVERLNRLRELFFGDAASLGERKIALTRLSTNAKFRSYAENATWELGRVLYATVDLPASNNHYRPEAGRNSEFEDRLVANRAWLLRLFNLAERKKLDGIVLFSEGDPGVMGALGAPGNSTNDARADGFAAPRRQIATLAKKFPGKVLLVDSPPHAGKTEPIIIWRDNVGHLSMGQNWTEVRVTPGLAPLFSIKPADKNGQ